MTGNEWKTYEEVAAFLLHQFAEHFGLGRFERKQVVSGESGAKWEIDAKGCAEDGKQFVIVECKRYPNRGISQAIVASLAWTIQDTGAAGGILVSPVGFQDGARKVAAATTISEVTLREDSTTTDYMLKFLNKIFCGVSDNISITESISIVIQDESGNVIETRRG